MHNYLNICKIQTGDTCFHRIPFYGIGLSSNGIIVSECGEVVIYFRVVISLLHGCLLVNAYI